MYCRELSNQTALGPIPDSITHSNMSLPRFLKCSRPQFLYLQDGVTYSIAQDCYEDQMR